MALPDKSDCECALCGWRGRVRFSSRMTHCGGCGVRHMVSIRQWLDLVDGRTSILVLDDPDRRGKRGRDRTKRAPRRA